MKKLKKLIGFSLSGCIEHILEGWVKEEQVVKIVANTAAKNENEWKKVVSIYSRSIWEKDPEKAKEIFKRFIDAGKIEQPRLKGEEPHCNNNGIWKEVHE